MMKNNGFTLIETLIYSGIVSGFITISLFLVLQMIEFRSSLENQRELNENQRFLIQKLNWALRGSAINSPAAGASAGSISVNKIGYASNPIVIDSLNGAVRLASGGGTALPITNAFASTTNLVFQNLNLSGKTVIRVTANLAGQSSSTTIDNFILIK